MSWEKAVAASEPKRSSPPVGDSVSRAPGGGARPVGVDSPVSIRAARVAEDVQKLGRSCQTMLSGVCARLASALRGTRAPPSAVALRCLHASSSRQSADKSDRTEKPPRAFDQALLEFLVCPLSKKPLRYEASTNELINEELGIAYPIIDGIPNMIPQAARMTHQNKKQEDVEQH